MRWKVAAVFVVSSWAPAAAAAPAVVAVFPIEDPAKRVDEATLRTLSDYLAARVGDIPGFSIIPSADLQQRIREQQAESYKACYDEACQIEIGKEVAATKAVSTKIAAIGDDCLLSSYLFDLARATTDATATVRAACDGQALLRAVDDVAARYREFAAKAAEASGVRYGSLEVASDPTGGEVFLDAVRTNKWTPAKLDNIPAGTHRIAVETDEASGLREVEIEASKTASIAVVLKPRPSVLVISTLPSGAEVTIGGKPSGTSPLTLEVAPGLLEIVARTADGQVGRATVFAKPARTPREISLVLTEDKDLPVEQPGLRIGWLIASGLMLGGGLAFDLASPTSGDHQLQGFDFIPVGLYALGLGAAALGIVPAL